MPAPELAAILMQMPVKNRLEVILRRQDSEAVVAAMPLEDFFFTVMEIGPDDALPLLAHARVEQLNLVFDVEWWQKADLVPAKALQWLERLEGASGKKLLEWLYHADFELLVSLFKKWIRVSLIDEDLDPLEAEETLPPNTIDDQYYWGAQYPQYEALIGRILGLLFEVNQGFYRELLNHTQWVSEAEVEEDAYRFHTGRLEDCAIPDYYDAVTIYGVGESGGAKGFRKKALRTDAQTAAPSFALSLVSEGDFLHEALQRVESHALLDSVRLELAAIANKILVADELAPDSAQSLHLAVHKAAAWVSLGLETVSRGDAGKAAALLGEVYLEDLFRRGNGTVASVRQRLQRIVQSGWIARWPAGLNVLDEPWHEAAELLLGKTPRLPSASGHGPQSPAEGLVKTRSDVARAKRVVDAILGGGFLFDALGGVGIAARRWNLWPEGQIGEIEDVTLGSQVWTAAARALESGEWAVEPLSLGRWPELFPRLDPKSMEAAIRSRVAKKVPGDSNRNAALAYLEPLFRAYADEMGPFIDKAPPDPGLLGFFLFAEE